MTYKYKNLTHVKLHGMEPYGTGEFDHPILGGGIELVKEKMNTKKKQAKVLDTEMI